jgi:TRAP-type C4-dicarboxylate transport system permease small subunit
MSTTKIVGILLIVAGALGLIYGGFTYTKDTHTAKLGPLSISVQEKETVMVPVIASVGALAIGLFLIVAGKNK